MTIVNFTFAPGNHAVRIDADHPRKKFRALSVTPEAYAQLTERFGELVGQVFAVSTTARKGAWKVESEDRGWFDGEHYVEYREFPYEVLDVCTEGVQKLMGLKSTVHPKAIYISKVR